MDNRRSDFDICPWYRVPSGIDATYLHCVLQIVLDKLCAYCSHLDIFRFEDALPPESILVYYDIYMKAISDLEGYKKKYLVQNNV